MTTGQKIKMNQDIRISRAEGEEDWYSSRVQDLDKNSFSIAIPVQGPNPLALKNGDLVKVSFVSEMSRFEFETKVVGRRSDNIPLYVLALPRELRRVQLREFVRIPLLMEAEFAEIPEAGNQAVFQKCACLELSGGGVRLLMKKEYPAGTDLLLTFTITVGNRRENIEVTGRVLRTWPDQNTKQYQTAIKFTDISRCRQDLIVRFVLQKMAEQRRLK